MSAEARVSLVDSPDDVATFRALCEEYAASLPFSLCFQSFDDEMRTLPGRYAQPKGCMLLAWSGMHPAGCAALRPVPEVGPGVCEMKRMYVRPTARGIGLGRDLAEALIQFAKSAGYERMVLDSEPSFAAALSLYESLGFVHRSRYNNDPDPHTVFMELRLD
jgi:GNAT superfamily N-acetyltransferase